MLQTPLDRPCLNMWEAVTLMPLCLYCEVTEFLTCSLSASVSTSPSPTPELSSFSQDGSTYMKAQEG